MLDHVSLQVADIAASGVFFDVVLAPLGGRRVLDLGFAVGFGRERPTFWIGPVTTEGAPRGSPRRLHRRGSGRGGCLPRRSRCGGRRGAPRAQVFPEYHPNYYGAFVRDPDGNNVEAGAVTTRDNMRELGEQPRWSRRADRDCQCVERVAGRGALAGSALSCPRTMERVPVRGCGSRRRRVRCPNTHSHDSSIPFVRSKMRRSSPNSVRSSPSGIPARRSTITRNGWRSSRSCAVACYNGQRVNLVGQRRRCTSVRRPRNNFTIATSRSRSYSSVRFHAGAQSHE